MTEKSPCDRISIVIPCYNARATLAATIESALKQDVSKEIIVVDDGSQDDSLAIARKFEPALQVITGPNRGASAARNLGIRHASSDWVLFLDADDLLETATLRKRLDCARDLRGDVVICDWQEVIDDGAGNLTPGRQRSVDWSALESDPEVAIATHVWATTAAILYHRSVVEKIGGFRPDLLVIQDARFMFDAAYHGARFVRSEHVGACYRILAGSLSRRNPTQFSRDILLNGQQIEQLWRARNSFDEAHRKVILGIYNTAGRSLFSTAHPSYFDAVAAQHELGLPIPLHSRVAAPLARLFGLQTARSLLGMVSLD